MKKKSVLKSKSKIEQKGQFNSKFVFENDFQKAYALTASASLIQSVSAEAKIEGLHQSIEQPNSLITAIQIRMQNSL
jgi:hypothetical protein